jgi:hypothetical protein
MDGTATISLKDYESLREVKERLPELKARHREYVEAFDIFIGVSSAFIDIPSVAKKFNSSSPHFELRYIEGRWQLKRRE